MNDLQSLPLSALLPWEEVEPLASSNLPRIVPAAWQLLHHQFYAGAKGG